MRFRFVLMCGLGACASAANKRADSPEPMTRTAATNSQFRLVSPEEALLRKCLPNVNDVEMQAVLGRSTTTLLHRCRNAPGVCVWDGQLQGLHSPQYNISADNSKPHRQRRH